jgi:hypothetical protein
MTSEHRGTSLRNFTTLTLYKSSSGVFLILFILSLFYLILDLFSFFIFDDFVLVFALMVIWVCVGILSFLRFKTMLIYFDFSTSE